MNEVAKAPVDLVKALEAIADDAIVDIESMPALSHLRSVFPPGFFKTIQLTKKQILDLSKDVVVTINTNKTLPIICTGSKCTIRHSCPFDKLGIAPVDNECALEVSSMLVWREQYITSLTLDVNDKVVMDLVDELVEIEIFNRYRFPAILNSNIDGFQETIYRYSDKTGALVEKRNEVSKALLAKMAMSKRKEAILKELLATPKQKVQYKRGKKSDMSSTLADAQAAAAIALKEIGVVDISTDPDDAE